MWEITQEYDGFTVLKDNRIMSVGWDDLQEAMDIVRRSGGKTVRFTNSDGEVSKLKVKARGRS